jgi:homogentisate 1,2-dioxygenase
VRKLVLIIAFALVAVPSALAANGSSSSPAQRCDVQRTAIGTTAFNQLYGTNADRSNAFGNCVSKLARADEQNIANASKACKAEQEDANFAANHGGKTFAQFYGTNKNGHNAFGRCVSQKAEAAAQAQQQATINAARACKAEQKANPTAFKNRYGTNANKSNAFGKCVSQKASA